MDLQTLSAAINSFKVHPFARWDRLVGGRGAVGRHWDSQKQILIFAFSLIFTFNFGQK